MAPHDQTQRTSCGVLARPITEEGSQAEGRREKKRKCAVSAVATSPEGCGVWSHQCKERRRATVMELMRMRMTDEPARERDTWRWR